MRRVWLIFSLFCFFYLLIVLRLFYWQIVKGGELYAQAISQYSLTLRIPQERGEILSQDGSPLVINQPAYLVYAEPNNIKDKLAASEKLAGSLGATQSALLETLSTADRVWIPLAHKVESELVDELKALALPGIGFEKEPKRFYAEASMAAQTLGFVASDQNGVDKGYFGLEGFYDRELKGKEGVLHSERDAKGVPILLGEGKRIEPQNGRTLVLWIDKAIQYSVERRLAEGIVKYGAREGSVVVMDPKTGGILAMASYPSYDPGSYTDYNKELYKNPVVAESYEPGSTLKTLIMSAGLNEGVITPDTLFDEKGPVPVGQYFIRTWNNEYNGSITMTKVLEKSSNVGMVFIGNKLGKDKLLHYIKGFGIGDMTGVDLQEETNPLLRADKEWHDIDLATATFGQGIAVTPLQMVRAVAALANGGWLMEPHVVKELRDATGKVVPIKPKAIRQVVSEATTHLVSEMMIASVENGEAKWTKLKGYRLAGKTGTAEIPVAGHYDANKTIASFVGFGPADDPKFVILVTLREPASSPWGSETAAPLFFKIAKDILMYLNIPPQ